MAPQLHWRVGPGDDAVVAVPEPERVVPDHPQRRAVLTLPLLVLYLTALACAGGIGFGIGRYTQARAAIADEVSRQLGVETVAWREADAGLLEATLDPAVPSAWRAAWVQELRQAAPRPDYTATLQSIRLVRPDLARVVVLVTKDGAARREDRMYEARGAEWYRTSEEQP
jgi:hypothetical protein